MSGDRVYVIAEAGVNHNGRRDLALALVDAAADSGANAVKFQTFAASKLAGPAAPKAKYQTRTTDARESQREMLERLELDRGLHRELQARAHEKGIVFLSTAFDADSLAFLVELGLPVFKVPSGELTNGPLLWQFARTQRPLILSTGMASLSEVEQALAIVVHGLGASEEPCDMDEVWRSWSDASCRRRLRGHVTLLHCTSQYPAPSAEVNLRSMDALSAAFGLDVGYSDHTEGVLITLAAVARGAKVIEKHFTLDRELPGPDQGVSLEPDELESMVRDIRVLETALGDGVKATQPSEWETRRAVRQHVVAARDIAQGALLAREDLTTSRTGDGEPATALWGMVGRVAGRSYRAGDVVRP